jgi:ATP-dependent DNA helicase DinG
VTGGDLPGWMPELFGARLLPAIADRRGECIHGACPHYGVCFVEHTIRRARGAQLVVANHALVMAQASWGGLDDALVPTRYVFDEGHHVFDAADGAFAAELSGMETAILRRWLMGDPDRRTRAKGLRSRLESMVGEAADLSMPLAEILAAAAALPGIGWQARLAAGPQGATERFLAAIRTQVLARAATSDSGYADLETPLHPAAPELQDAARALARDLSALLAPLRAVRERLEAALEQDAESLDTDARRRVEAALRMIRHRAVDRVTAWMAMLSVVLEPAPEPGVRPQYVHLLTLDRRDGRDLDAALARHWLDPTEPFAATLARPAHGLLVTSATLRDTGLADVDAAWLAAEARVGATHLPSPALRVAVASPFNYAAQTRCFVVTDVGPDVPALAGAYRALFQAAGGGALGLFTAIRRLQDVHARIAGPLDEAGLTLLAQHVDAMDAATLVDVFRTETDSCLLGTDAMRDGVDVPGRSLRLVVFDRVPWPRPELLHKERRIHLSGGDPKAYDDARARQRLRQAFGRLVRSSGDRGVFVLLDRRAPSRLMGAFPEGVEVRRVGLAEAVAATRAFVGPDASVICPPARSG